MILMKNLDSDIPLPASINNVSVVGPMANASTTMISDPSYMKNALYIITLLRALQAVR